MRSNFSGSLVRGDNVEVSISSIDDVMVNGSARITVDGEYNDWPVSAVVNAGMTLGQMQLHLLKNLAEDIEKELAVVRSEISEREANGDT